MTNSDIRVGNYMKNFLGEVFPVNASTIYEWNNPSEFEKPKPIPINEEWLTKLGWKYYNGKNDGDLTMDTDVKIDLDWIDGKLKVKSHYEPSEMYRPVYNIQYVHQLQNIYHSLTQQELTIKP